MRLSHLQQLGSYSAHPHRPHLAVGHLNSHLLIIAALTAEPELPGAGSKRSIEANRHQPILTIVGLIDLLNQRFENVFAADQIGNVSEGDFGCILDGYHLSSNPPCTGSTLGSDYSMPSPSESQYPAARRQPKRKTYQPLATQRPIRSSLRNNTVAGLTEAFRRSRAG